MICYRAACLQSSATFALTDYTLTQQAQHCSATIVASFPCLSLVYLQWADEPGPALMARGRYALRARSVLIQTFSSELLHQLAASARLPHTARVVSTVH